eukprot:c8960_g1_i1 orf=58-423(-)
MPHLITSFSAVLSAVGGLQRVFEIGNAAGVVVTLSVVILVLLFMVQRFGTSKVGFMFAPAVLLWFSFIGTIGLYNIFNHDSNIFKAFNPKYIYLYFERNKKDGWISLGGIVLAVTGIPWLI